MEKQVLKLVSYEALFEIEGVAVTPSLEACQVQDLGLDLY